MRFDLRVAATTATLNRFAGQKLDHSKPRGDCGKMVIAHMRNMGRRPKINGKGTWNSLLGLRRFLEAHGGSGAACLDGWKLPRIAPAKMIVGDIVEMPGEPPFGAFGVCVGNGRVLCWAEHEEAGDTAVILAPTMFIAAWRV